MTTDPASWYIPGEGKQPTGPFTVEHLIQSCRAGRLDANTLCWREGMSQWLPLADVEPFASVVASSSVRSQATAGVARSPAPRADAPPRPDGATPPPVRRRGPPAWFGWAIAGTIATICVAAGVALLMNERITAKPPGAADSENATNNHSRSGSISTTDLGGTIQRTGNLFSEWESEVSRARDQNRGNRIAIDRATARVNDESRKKIEGEFSKLHGQTIEWRFTVKEVGQDAIVFEEAPTATAFSGNRLYIYFSNVRDKGYHAGDPGYLLIGNNAPRSFAEKLRPGDHLLIKGSAQVYVGERVGPFRNSMVNDHVVVAIHLSEIDVRAEQMEQEGLRQRAEEQATELTRRRTASRDAVVQDVRKFLSQGSVFNATYFSQWPNQHKDPNLPFQVTITGDLAITMTGDRIEENNNASHPVNQKFTIPAHFKWLGDTETLSSSSWGNDIKEHDGMFFGEVNRDNATGMNSEWRVTMKYCVRDKSHSGYWDGREDGSTWNGSQFEGNSKSAISLRTSGGPRVDPPTRGPAVEPPRRPGIVGEPATPQVTPPADEETHPKGPLSGNWQALAGARFRIEDDGKTLTIDLIPNEILQTLSGKLTRDDKEPNSKSLEGTLDAVFIRDAPKRYRIPVTGKITDPNQLSLTCKEWPQWDKNGNYLGVRGWKTINEMWTRSDGVPAAPSRQEFPGGMSGGMMGGYPGGMSGAPVGQPGQPGQPGRPRAAPPVKKMR